MLTFPRQITKAVDISIIPAPAGSRLPYVLDIKGGFSALNLIWPSL